MKNETCKTCVTFWPGKKEKHNLCRNTWKYVSQKDTCDKYESIDTVDTSNKTVCVKTNWR